MSNDDPSPEPNSPHAQSDPFRPPAVPTLVHCLHCHNEFDSYRIEWRIETSHDGKKLGFWCCPMPGCDGRGFGFDILPVDPNYRDERGGWFSDDGEEGGEGEFDEAFFDNPQDSEPIDDKREKFDAEKTLGEVLEQVDESKLDEEDDEEDEKVPY